MLPTKTIEELLKPEPFIAWLATQPPEKVYNYDLGVGCPVSIYLKKNGYAWAIVSTSNVYCNGTHVLPPELDAIARYNFYELKYDGIRTYGGALNAAREWQKALATS